MKRRSLWIAGSAAVVMVAMVLLLAGLPKVAANTQKVASATNEVKIDNFSFGPGTIAVAVGTTVTWTNRDDIPHTVVCAGKFRSKTLDTDGKFTFTFAAAGEYKYFCSLHPHMTGVVKVE
jgi:plastocyanin